MGESLIITCLPFSSSNFSNVATLGSQSDMATVFPPCSLRRAGSRKIQSTAASVVDIPLRRHFVPEYVSAPVMGNCAWQVHKVPPGVLCR